MSKYNQEIPIFELYINGKLAKRSTRHAMLKEVAFAEANSIFGNNKVCIVNTESGECEDF